MDWFNSDYYHILYKNRDYKEAEKFLKKIIKKLQLDKGLKVLDLACGKGRHSIFLEKQGFKVTGIDNSLNNIKKAKLYQNKNLKFFKREMIEEIGGKFDVIFNLFTSFGYVNKEYNIKTIRNINNHLSQNGFVIIDYLNSKLAEDNLVKNENKLIDGLEFRIKRYSDPVFIHKTIEFIDEKDYLFKERVMKLSVDDFKYYLEKHNLKIIKKFGNYNLDDFVEDKSERLIMIIKKSQP